MNTDLREQRIRNNRLRRKRELRRRGVSLLVLMMTVIFLSTFFSLRTRAESSQREVLTKYYSSIRVQSGDTLWGYACQYGNSQYYESIQEYVEEVIEINSLVGDTITSGQYLILPYYVSVQPESAGPGNQGCRSLDETCSVKLKLRL